MAKKLIQQYISTLCDKHLEYQFKDLTLLDIALTHRSSSGSKNNERLEFLGDSLLNFVISNIIFKRYPEHTEGELTRIRAELVSREMLAVIAKEISLGDCIVLGGGESSTGGHQRTSILANVMEALFGAIYLDSDIYTLCAKVEKLYDKKITEVGDSGGKKDAKTQLQEWLQGKKHTLPTYRVLKIEGKPHEQVFYVKCKVLPFEEEVVGVAGSRRKAEQDAALKMLEKIKDKKVEL